MHIIVLGFDSSQPKDILFGLKALLKIALGNMLYPLVAMKIAPAQSAGLSQKNPAYNSLGAHVHIQICRTVHRSDWKILTEMFQSLTKQQANRA